MADGCGVPENFSGRRRPTISATSEIAGRSWTVTANWSARGRQESGIFHNEYNMIVALRVCF